jgi:hypothetical protein
VTRRDWIPLIVVLVLLAAYVAWGWTIPAGEGQF